MRISARTAGSSAFDDGPGAPGSDHACSSRLAALELELARIHGEVAAQCMSQSLYAETLVHLRLACRMDTNNVELRNQLGTVYHLTGDDVGALECYRGALEIDVTNADAHYNCGMALYAIDCKSESEASLATAAETDADNADNWNNLGAVRFDIGRVDEARKCFEKALELEPNHADARANLAELSASHGH